MKATIRAIFVAGLSFAMLTACGPTLSLFTPFLGGSQTAETAAITAAGTAQSSGSGYGSPFARTTSAGTLTAGATEIQYYTITFQNGIVDANSMAAGILLYYLQSASSSTETYVRGSLLPYTATVVGNTSGGSIVTLAIAAANLPASTTAYVELTLTKSLTANGGARSLDSDLDGVDGEDEDEFVLYPAVTSGTAMTGLPKVSPSSTVGFTAPVAALVAATGTVSFSAADVAGAYTTLVDLTSGIFTMYKFTSGNWAAVTPTVTYDTATGNGTIAVAGWAAGEVYKLKWDKYAIAEKSAVRGYVHRLSTAQLSTSRLGSAIFVIGATTFNTAALAGTPDGGTDYARWIDVVFTPSGSSKLNVDTVTTSTLRVRDTTNARWVNWSSVGIQDTAGTTLRIFMPSTFQGATGDGYAVYIYPGVTDTASPAVPFGSLANTDGNITALTGTW